MTKIVALGIGNTLNRDEGVGVHAVSVLRDRYARANPDVDFLDGGTLGLNLLPIVEESDRLLVLDAIDARQPPGAVIQLAGPDIPLFVGIKLSPHQITFQELLGLATARNRMPAHVALIGVQPADITIGLELSEPVAAALPEVIRRAAAVLAGWGVAIESETDETDPPA